jgi:hypothetical protein
LTLRLPTAREQPLRDGRVNGTEHDRRDGDDPGVRDVVEHAQRDPAGREAPPVPLGHADLVDQPLPRPLDVVKRDPRLRI